MIQILEKKNCTGCSACSQKCPKSCISMKMDEEGFLYPKVTPDLCIECGICEKVCPVLNTYKSQSPFATYAAVNSDSNQRMKSSSGGIFILLAQQVLKQGGVVFGVRFNQKWQAVFDYIEDPDDLYLFCGSKYLQASVGKAYQQVLQFLREGRKVLFSGTPCQIAGLNRFLGKEYDNLLSVDVACHGVPSPKVWELYLSETCKGKGLSIKEISFRNKRHGWKDFNIHIVTDKLSINEPFWKNWYMKAFLSDLILRPSCYFCKAKNCSCHSDLTLADYWGVQFIHPEIDDNMGTSLVLVNTVKGQEYFEKIPVKKLESSYKQACAFNSALVASSAMHPGRADFFGKLSADSSIKFLIKQTLSKSKKEIIREYLRFIKYQIKNRKLKNDVHG